MKKVLKIGILVLTIFLFSGCKNDYNKVSYREFNGLFNDLNEYEIIDKSLINQGIFKRSYEAGNTNYTYYYYEFDNKKEAENYLVRNYQTNDGYSYKKNKEYTVVKHNVGSYMKGVRIDNVVIIGQGKKFFDRFEINKIMGKLGV